MGGSPLFINPVRWFRDPDVARALITILNVAPYMESGDEVSDFVSNTLSPLKGQLPYSLESLRVLGHLPWLSGQAFHAGLYVFARRFVVYDDLAGLVKTIEEKRDQGFEVSVDYMTERVRTETERERVSSAYGKLFHLPIDPPLESVSMKLSSFCPHMHPEALKLTTGMIMESIAPRLKEASEHGTRAFFDAEETEMSLVYDTTLGLAYKKFGSTVCAVLQAYRCDATRCLDRYISMSDPKDPMIVRLVCGAYWEYECRRAEKLRIRCPVHTKKWMTEDNFVHLFGYGASHGLRMVAATQNPHLLARIARLGVPVYGTQYIRGMGETHAIEMRQHGYPGTFYVPTLYPGGTLNEALPYMGRRGAEFADQHSATRITNREIRKIVNDIPVWREV